MSQPIILIMTRGCNVYDHNADIEHELRYEQATKDEHTIEMYINHAKRTYAHSRIAWFAMNELNVITGENKQIFYEAKPIQQRIEVNVAAKVAKKSWKSKEMAWDASAFNNHISTPQTTASILAQIAAMQANQSELGQADNPEVSNDF